MSLPSDYGMLLTTVASRDDATKLARLLIDEKLAACVQLLPIESFYRWDGKTQNEAELLLLIKTRTALFEAAIPVSRRCIPIRCRRLSGRSSWLASMAIWTGSTKTRVDKKMATPAGFEPATTGLEGRCSIQLSYGVVRRSYRNQCDQGTLRSNLKLSE